MGGGTGEPARIGRRRQRSSGLSQRPPVDLDMVLALSAVPTAVLGPSGKIANANDAFWSWSGYDAHQLVGRRVHDLLDPADHAGFDHDLQRLGWPGRVDRRARAERAVLAADGRRRWAVVDLVALPPDTGQALLVSQWTDVSELGDLEERKRQRALEDGELASFVSALVRADDPEAVLTGAAARVAAVVGDTCAVFRANGTRRLREFTWQTRRPDALDPTRPLSADLST